MLYIYFILYYIYIFLIYSLMTTSPKRRKLIYKVRACTESRDLSLWKADKREANRK